MSREKGMIQKKARFFSVFDKVFILCALILILCLFFIPFLDRNNRALFYFFQKKYILAEQKWLSALSERAFSPFYRMNLALNYMLSERPEKSLKEHESLRTLIKNDSFSPSRAFFKKKKILYSLGHKESQGKKHLKQGVLKPSVLKEDILFYSFFNSAVSALQKAELEKALRFYQQALIFRPQSLEVKTNIELLTAPLRTADRKDKQKKNKKQKNNEQEKKKNPSRKDSEKKEQDSSGKKNEPSKEQKKQGKQQKGEEGSLEPKQKGLKGEKQKPEGSSPLRGRQKMDERQTEAILKAILNQENEIRKRRQKARKKPSNFKKDW